MNPLRRAALWLFALVVVAGCASTEVTDRQRYQDEKLAQPDRIIVDNLTGNPADVPPESPFAAQLAGTDPGAARGWPRAGRRDRRASGGGSAEHGAARRADRRPTGASGRRHRAAGNFVSIDQGSATKRVLVGFGSGAAEIRVAVEGYQMTAQGLRLLGSGEVRSGGGKTPGTALPLAVLAATANPLGPVVAGTAKLYGEGTGSDRIEGTAERTAARQLRSKAGTSRIHWLDACHD